MLQIQRISAYPYQKQTIVLDNGELLSITIYFRPIQSGWFFNELTYRDFVLQGLRITNQPNMLYQWKNKLPFGLGCFSTANREPSLQQDFSTGNSKLYILTEAEVDAYTTFLQGG